jgi:RNA polymerase primary sigma factor
MMNAAKKLVLPYPAAQASELRLYSQIVERCPVLTPAQTRKLVARYKQHHDTEAYETLICHNLRMVIWIAKRYRNRGVDFPDLVQEGVIGLMWAIEKFDLSMNFRLGTYAYTWIQQKIMRLLDDQGALIRVPVHMQENIRRLDGARLYLKERNGSAPTVEELSEATGFSAQVVQRMLGAKLTKYPLELDAPVPRHSSSDHEADSWGEFLANPSALAPDQLAEVRSNLSLARRRLVELRQTLATFNQPRDRDIFLARYGFDDGSYQCRKITVLADRFHISRQRTQQILARILRQLKVRTEAMEELACALAIGDECEAD